MLHEMVISYSNQLANLKKEKREFMQISANSNSEGFSSINKAELTNLVKRKDLELLRNFNGVEGCAKALKTNLEDGISNGQDTERRKIFFGSNTTRKQSLPKSFFYFLFEAFKDTSKLLQLGFTVISFGFMIKQKRYKEGWYDGGSIVAAVLVIALSGVSNFIHKKQLHYHLSEISNNYTKIDVVREGRRQKISIFEIVVGDVVVLNIGDQIPADGLFIDGHSLLVDDESSMIDIDSIRNPFLISGSKVIDGNARMLVISVGMNKDSEDDQQTTLQSHVNNLSSSVSKVACLVSFIDLLGILIRYFSGNTKDDDDQDGIDISLVISNLAAIAEGLSLAFTVNLVYSSKGMMDSKVMIRKLSACETMGSATVICTHKTGTLTMNQMEVAKVWLGLDHIDQDGSTRVVVDEKIIHLFHQGFGLNTTGSVYKSSDQYCGSCPTEKAILSWGVMNLGMEMEKMKESYTILHVEAFNSEKKRSGVLIKKKDDNTIHLHWKGAAEMVLASCSNYYHSRSGLRKSINDYEKTRLKEIIEGTASSGFKCMAFAHKQIPAEDQKHNEDIGITCKTLNDEGLTLLAIVGMKNLCRPGVKEAIKTCRSAGVDVKMITGDNIFTAKAIATECGILQVNGQVIEGEEFRNYTEEERMKKAEIIQVMARSSPRDKLLMVQCLKKKGHVVAVTGHHANDVPALKEADIGVSMGIEGTEVVKESSDIVIVDDDFGSIVMGLKWGRCVFNNMQKLIQFLLPANIASIIINFISYSSGGGLPLTAIQMLWVNLIMVTLGGLALAIEKPTKEVMLQKPADLMGGFALILITNVMWRNLLAQSVFQIAIVLTFWFRGRSFFNVNEKVKNTIIFNTFVFCQLFNQLNSRKLEKMNVFEDLHKNRLFMVIIGVTIVLQVVMVEFLNNFEETERLNWKQWGICVATATLSWPICWLSKLIPIDKPLMADLDRIRILFRYML